MTKRRGLRTIAGRIAASTSCPECSAVARSVRRGQAHQLVIEHTATCSRNDASEGDAIMLDAHRGE